MNQVVHISSIENVFANMHCLFIRGSTDGPELKKYGVVFIESEFQLSKSTFFTYKYKGDDLYLFNRESKKFDLHFVKSNYILGSSSHENKFLLFDKNDDYRFCLVFDNIKSEDLFIEKNLSLFYENLLVSTSGKSLTRCNIIECFFSENLNLLWNYTLPEGYNIYLKPEVIGKVFFFKAYDENRKNQLVTGLDIFTGKILWQNNYRVTNENKFISAPAFNSTNSLFYGLGHIFQVFNPQTGEIIFEKAMEEIEKHKLDIYVNAVYDNKLWFVSGKYEEVRFGYVNLNNNQIELLQNFPQDNDEVFDTPVYHEGKLYLRGKFYNNLYVFE